MICLYFHSNLNGFSGGATADAAGMKDLRDEFVLGAGSELPKFVLEIGRYKGFLKKMSFYIPYISGCKFMT